MATFKHVSRLEAADRSAKRRTRNAEFLGKDALCRQTVDAHQAIALDIVENPLLGAVARRRRWN